MAEEKKDTIFNSSKCLKFKIDSLASTVAGIVPSAMEGLAQGIKEAKIGEALTKAAGDINALATNALQNFKDIASGKLPEIELPNLEKLTSSLFNKIDSETQALFNEFNSLANAIGDEINSFQSFLDDQISCVENDYLKGSEISSIQGNLMDNISKGVSEISDVQLRDFNLNTDLVDGAALQAEFSGAIAKNAENIQKQISLQGKSFSEQAKSQSDVLSNFDSLEIQPPNLTGITDNIV